MAIYMNYQGIDGPVTTAGHEKWIELSSFHFGVGRAIGTAQRGQTSREHSEPNLSEITVTKLADTSTLKLWHESVAGTMDKTVKIDFTTTTQNKTVTFLTYELSNVGLSGYSAHSTGDMPQESLSLNFTKIQISFTGMDPSISGNKQSDGYDLTQMSTI